MVSAKKLMLETILASSLILLSPSFPQAQNKKAPEYIIWMDYFNLEKNAKKQPTTLEDTKKFINEKLKGYDAEACYVKLQNRSEYKIKIKVYDKSLTKSQLEKKFSDLTEYSSTAKSLKEFNDDNELRKIYVNIVEDLLIKGNIESFKKYLAENAIDVNADKTNNRANSESYLSVLDKGLEEVRLKNKNAKCELITDYYPNVTPCTEIPDAFQNYRKYYTPKQGDYDVSGYLYFKIKNKTEELKFPADLIFRKINNQWKIIVID